MGYKELLSSIDCKFVVIIEDDFKQIEYKKERALYDITRSYTLNMLLKKNQKN